MAVSYIATVEGVEFGFDFADTRIDVPATVDSLNIQNLWTAIKEAMASEPGRTYDTIARGGGLDVLDAGQGAKTYLTVTLLGTWEINSLKLSGKFTTFGGNILRMDGSDPFRDNPLITYIALISQAGTSVETGTSGLTPAESTKLAQLDTSNLDAAVSTRATATQVAEAIRSLPIDSDIDLQKALKVLVGAMVRSGVYPIEPGDQDWSAQGADGEVLASGTIAADGTRTGVIVP